MYYYNNTIPLSFFLVPADIKLRNGSERYRKSTVWAKKLLSPLGWPSMTLSWKVLFRKINNRKLQSLALQQVNLFSFLLCFRRGTAPSRPAASHNHARERDPQQRTALRSVSTNPRGQKVWTSAPLQRHAGKFAVSPFHSSSHHFFKSDNLTRLTSSPDSWPNLND